VAVIVSLCDVIEELDLMSDEATAYINWKTGELITWARADFEKRAPLGREALRRLTSTPWNARGAVDRRLPSRLSRTTTAH